MTRMTRPGFNAGMVIPLKMLYQIQVLYNIIFISVSTIHPTRLPVNAEIFHYNGTLPCCFIFVQKYSHMIYLVQSSTKIFVQEISMQILHTKTTGSTQPHQCQVSHSLIPAFRQV